MNPYMSISTTCHMMNLPLFCIHLGFLEWCCLYSSLDSNENITYYVDPSSKSPKLISPVFCYYMVFCSCLHYNRVYFNYLLLYLKKKENWLPEEVLQIAVKGKEVKGKIHPFECRVPKNSKEK